MCGRSIEFRTFVISPYINPETQTDDIFIKTQTKNRFVSIYTDGKIIKKLCKEPK